MSNPHPAGTLNQDVDLVWTVIIGAAYARELSIEKLASWSTYITERIDKIQSIDDVCELAET